ncbi:MAG: manganese efflux pump MntP family protein [Oscillospiraceae bacterium]|nr:manganese efflux pump MntP family protein [Oscillospiraceae bacterium]
MNILELSLIAVGLSMDAFAVSVCIGLTMRRFTLRNALVVGAYFGAFQAGMPVIGYFAAALFADKVDAFAHWIAFALLVILGVKMIVGSFSADSDANKDTPQRLGIKQMLPLAVATSIDAMAVGVTFAFFEVNITFAVLLIGVTTLALSILGVKIGNAFGSKFKTKAEIFGGIVLVLIGVKILLEGLIA